MGWPSKDFGRLNFIVLFDLFQISHKDEEVREEVISLYQTVQQFKGLLHQWFDVPMQNMKLYYCDQVTFKT